MLTPRPLFESDLFGDEMIPKSSGPLAEKFLFVPFSVLSAREGNWQNRKRAWLGLGIKSEIGRSVRKNVCSSARAMDISGSFSASHYAGQSIFDPVLCELCYRWFCPEGGQIVDPFAGGSVRGIVAGFLGFRYWGCDLRVEQIAANNQQADEIKVSQRPEWVCGDAMDALDAAPDADFVFSCPPYGDLERYSDDPADLSTMEYHTFIATYKRIILRCAKKLKPGGMACFVVGDFRDKRTGNYRGFVADTIIAFRECGLELYNDAILLTPIGNLHIRVSGQFEKSKKLGKTHQNILVFRKGF